MKQVCVAWLLLLCVTGAAGALGGACTGTSDCSDANQVCDNLKCKIKAGAACTTGTDDQHCVTNSTCSGASGAGTCDCDGSYVPDAGFCKVDVAGSCAGGESTKCKTGTVCDAADSNVCNLDVGESCASHQNDCKTGTVCDAGDSNVCNLDVGQSCASHQNDCKTGTVCDAGDSNVCNIEAGAACTDGTDSQHCVTNSTCSGTSRGAGTCNCGGSYVTDAGFCKRKVDESCATNDDCAGSNVECSTSLVCTCKAGKSANSDKSDCSGVAGLAGSVLLLIAALVMSRFL